MTLFSPNDLNQVFPEATPDALVDPNLNVYTGYAEAYVEAQESAGRISLTGGKKDEIDEIINSGLINESNDSEKPFELLIDDAYSETIKLFSEIGGTLPLDKEILESFLENVDMEDLEEKYKLYRELGLEPKVIINPQGINKEYWQNLFSKLYNWQKLQDPNKVIDRLGNTDKGNISNPNILSASKAVLANWFRLTGSSIPCWDVNIVTNLESAPIKKVNSHGRDVNNYRISSKFLKYKAIVDNDYSASKIHPLLETYLTQQALSIMNNGHALDTLNNKFTWIYGTINDLTDALIPSARFNKDTGQIEVSLKSIDSGEWHNIRPTYRAKTRDAE